MTIVAARKYSDCILFSCDSQVTRGNRKTTPPNLQAKKIFTSGEMTIGGAGLLSDLQWLHKYSESHGVGTNVNEYSISEYMTDFVRWMRKLDSNYQCKSDFLIAHGTNLFECFEATSVFVVPEYSCIGSGRDFALAAMYLNNTPEQACTVATAFCLYCQGPVSTYRHQFGK